MKRGARGSVPDPAPARHSAAWLDALVCPIRVARAPLAAALAPIAGLSLEPARGARTQLVVIEIWRVREGRVEAAGLDAHDWSQLAGSAAGLAAGGTAGGGVGAAFGGLVGAAGGGVLGLALGPAGVLFGALAGSVAGLSAGAALGAAGAAAYGAGLGGAVSRRVSETGSRLLGSYGEVLVTTRCRLATPEGPRPVAYVLGMYTDSRLSRWGEAALGFGFGKRAAQVKIDGAAVQIRASGTARLEVALRRAPAPAPLPARSPAAERLRAMAALPLAGRRGKRLVLSRLERHFDAREVRIWPAAAELEVGAGFVPGVAAGRHVLIPGRAARGAFAVTDLPVHLSYPQGAGRLPLRRAAER